MWEGISEKEKGDGVMVLVDAVPEVFTILLLRASVRIVVLRFNGLVAVVLTTVIGLVTALLFTSRVKADSPYKAPPQPLSLEPQSRVQTATFPASPASRDLEWSSNHRSHWPCA